MDISSIKKTVSLYYQDSKALERIQGSGSDFVSSFDKCLASWFVSRDEEFLSKLSKTKEFKEIQSSIYLLEDFLNEIPEMESFLNYKNIIPSFLKSKKENSKIEGEYSWEEYSELLLQTNLENISVDYLTQICLSLALGNKDLFQEEMETNPDPELFRESVDLKLKQMGIPSLKKESLEELLLTGKVLKYKTGDFTEESYGALIKSFWLFPENSKENLNFFLKNKGDIEFIKELWSPFVFRIVSFTMEDRVHLINELRDISSLDSKFLDKILMTKNDSVGFLIKNKIFSEKEVLDGTFNVLKKRRNLELFKLIWESIDLVISKESSEFQSFCTLMNNSSDLILSQGWDLVCRGYVLNKMNRGNQSFSFHYPSLYKDIVDLDNERMFYTENDFKNHLKERNLESLEKEFIRDTAESLSNKISVIHKILKEDLEKGVNRFSGVSFSDRDLSVLSSFEEKLNSALVCCGKIVEKTKNPNFSVSSLFFTQENMASIPNLKGFYLGELKIGGLENYDGHGTQLREILSPLGFVVSSEIRKEIDHFIKIGEGNKIQLILVESKNFKKALTRRSPKIFEVLTQKERLNESLDQARSEIFKKEIDFDLRVDSSLCLSRGFSKGAKRMLTTPLMYDEVQGIEIDFSQSEPLVDESFKMLVVKLKKRIEENKPILSELFEDEINDISNLMLMVEEDSQEKVSDGGSYSDFIQSKVAKILKKYYNEFKEKKTLVNHVFAEFVKVLDRKIKKIESEEAV